MEKMNFSRHSQHSTNSNQVLILSSKNESSFLSSLYEKITNLWKSNDQVEEKLLEPKDTIRVQLCKCPKTKSRDYCDNIHELIQMTKNGIFKQKCKELYYNLLKINDKTLDITGDNLRQIQKDITRTYPPRITFNHKEKILKKLENVLRAFSAYDNKIKYCQGMNFIVAFLLYHCEEYVAFWLFVSIIEEYDLRNTYMENFPGLQLHVKRVEEILKNEYKFYWENLNKIGVKFDIIMVNWLFSLFSSLIPLELQMDFYKGFFSQGWIFFYQMCISCITNLKGKYYEVDEIYIALKNDENKNEEEIVNYWKNIIQNAYKIKIKTDVLNISNRE
jgi:CDGSH-type Zn-finger protein